MKFSTHHINYLERAFLDNEEKAELHQAEWLAINTNSLRLVQITSVPRSSSSTTVEQLLTTKIDRMGDVLAGVHGLRDSLVYGIIGQPTEVKLFMATCQHTQFNQNDWVLPTILRSAYPGIELKTIQQNTLFELQQLLRNLPHTAIITGTPTLKSEPNPTTDQPLDSLIRALYGRQWAYILVAKPLTLPELHKLSNLTLNELQLVTNAEQSSSSVNPIAEKYKQILNGYWDKLQSGKSQGMWHTIAYLLANNLPTITQAKALGGSLFSGKLSLPDPIRVLNAQKISKQIATFALPLLPPPKAPGKVEYPFQYLSLLSSAEVATMLHLPTREVAGYFVHQQVKFDVTPHHTSTGNNNIKIGEIINQGQNTQTDYAVELNSFTRHTMIVGTTGCGKTNTVLEERVTKNSGKRWKLSKPKTNCASISIPGASPSTQHSCKNTTMKSAGFLIIMSSKKFSPDILSPESLHSKHSWMNSLL